MEAYSSYIYVFTAVFAIVSTIAGYVLHRKTKTLSTLIIFIGFLLVLISSIIFVAYLGFTTLQKYLVVFTIVSIIGYALTSIGFFAYAIKLKSEQ